MCIRSFFGRLIQANLSFIELVRRFQITDEQSDKIRACDVCHGYSYWLRVRCRGLTRHKLSHGSGERKWQLLEATYLRLTHGATPKGKESCSPWKHTSYAGHPRERRRLSRWLQRLVRRFHLCSGEKHVDSDRALPTGVCLLSKSRPRGERS